MGKRKLGEYAEQGKGKLDDDISNISDGKLAKKVFLREKGGWRKHWKEKA